ncbi:MAG: glycoside hydrolase family 78 protein, partial [Aggregatilineales bacterium]
MTTIANLTCEYRTDPMGIDVTNPRLAWQMQTDRMGARQTAYQIFAAGHPDRLSQSQADLWDSGKIESDQSLHIIYAGQKLASRQRVYWKVMVWDEAGTVTQSVPAWFEMGLLKRKDWRARWIGASLVGGPRSTIPAPYLRKSFTVPGAIKAARLYVTALGFYECSIDGQPVSLDVFNPGWTDYRKRVQYKVYDVSNMLHEGENVLGALLGDGWAVGHTSWNHRQQYVDRPQLFAQLEIVLADGGTLTIATDRTWKYQVGPLMESDMLMGEAYDARREMPGWDKPGFDDKRWQPVEVFDDLGMALVATNGPTVRRIEELKPIGQPVDKSRASHKRYLYDLGQNMVGRVRIKASAPAGTTITLRFAEALDADGSIYTTNLRTARATDYYTFKGQGEEIWEPKFTFHGFRYVQLEGYPGDVANVTITGVVLHSELTPTGNFECSDPIINQLQHNIVWGQKGNFVDVPTDCPQRDERLGWTGDIQVFVRTAAFNMNIAGFMTKWAHDVADAQDEQGAVPPFVPSASSDMTDGGPAWADAAIICPWTIFLCYGDRRILETNYSVMTHFMDFLIKASPGFIRCAPDYKGWPGFGDWLSINATTPRDLIGTAFLAYDAKLMAQIATILGKKRDATKYQKLFADVKAAFGGRYLKGSKLPTVSVVPSENRKRMDDADATSRGNLKAVDYGPIQSHVFNTDLFTPTQTAYVLALHFDLLPENLRPVAAAELVADIKRRELHLSTGFVGSPYLPHVLSNNGQLDTAYALLHQKTWPSWLYSVTQGATTIWERWDGWTPENGFQSPEMNSFNHYAYGAIGAWLYNTVAGIEIDPAQPGYKHAVLRPQPGGGLTHAFGKLRTLYGELISEWKIEKGNFDWTVIVPPNTTASLHLPAKDGQKITLNGKAVSGACHEQIG